MTIVYNIPLQTVTFSWTPEEQMQLTDEAAKRLKQMFCDMVTNLKHQIKDIESKPKL